MAKVYDDNLTAAQVAVAREYRKAKAEMEKERDHFERVRDEWAEVRTYLEPKVNELKQGLIDMGLNPADFD